MQRHNPPHHQTTGEAAALVGFKNREVFVQHCERHGVKPVGASKKPYLWRGADLWKLLEYEPPRVHASTIRANASAAHRAIQEVRRANRLAANAAARAANR